jgi:hypothetical protein
MQAIQKEFTGTVPAKSQFDSLKDALAWVNGLMSQGLPVCRSIVASDLFNPGKNRSLLVLGVHSKAEALCKRLAPGFKWNVHAHKTMSGPYQFMAWYDSYTPYAVAMMESEEGFECKGIEHESVVGYWKTVMGFLSIADFVNDEEGQLFVNIYGEACKVKPPYLVFEEMYFPAIIYCCLKAPRRWQKYFKDRDSKNFEKMAEVLTNLKIEIPKHLAKALKR